MRRYPEYRESGVEWLPEIPSHWRSARVKHVARPEPGAFTDGDWIESPYIVERGIRLIQTGNVGVGHYKEQGYRFISEETFRELTCTEVFPGDVLICRLASPVGRACLAPDLGARMVTAVDNCILRPSCGFDARFVVYQLSTREYLDFVDFVARGGTRSRISRSMLGDLAVVAPPVEEQRRIADFLDRKTAQIDTLIQKKQALIELLREQRTALINRAVTKGLDPEVPMKESGSVQLGEIPSHWSLSRVKYVCGVRGRIGFRGYTTDDLVPQGQGPLTLGATHVDELGQIDLSHPVFISWEKYHESPEIKLGIGDVLVVQRGSCGKVGIIESDIGPATINPSLVLLRAAGIESKYMFYCLRGSFVQDTMNLRLSATAVPMLSQEQIGNFQIPLPPRDEQAAIVGRLDKELNRMDELIQSELQAGDLLRELRASLISEVVTGKIDVRGAVVGSDDEGLAA